MLSGRAQTGIAPTRALAKIDIHLGALAALKWQLQPEVVGCAVACKHSVTPLVYAQGIGRGTQKALQCSVRSNSTRGRMLSVTAMKLHVSMLCVIRSDCNAVSAQITIGCQWAVALVS